MKHEYRDVNTTARNLGISAHHTQNMEDSGICKLFFPCRAALTRANLRQLF
jgi:hypothetical protein